MIAPHLTAAMKKRRKEYGGLRWKVFIPYLQSLRVNISAPDMSKEDQIEALESKLFISSLHFQYFRALNRFSIKVADSVKSTRHYL